MKTKCNYYFVFQEYSNTCSNNWDAFHDQVELPLLESSHENARADDKTLFDRSYTSLVEVHQSDKHEI